MVTEAATREGTLAQGLSDISGAGKEQCVKESQEMSNAQNEHPEPTWIIVNQCRVQVSMDW